MSHHCEEFWPHFCHSLSLSVHLVFCLESPPQPPSFLFLFSPPLSFGSLGICFFFFFCKFGTGPNPNQMFNRRHPKYMKAHSAQHMGPRSAESKDCHLRRQCGGAGNYRLRWLRLVYFCFTLCELSIVPMHVHMRGCT